MINLTENEVIKSMLISKETIKSEDSSLRVENTSEGLKASITSIDSDRMEQETSTKGKNILPTAKIFWESGHYDTTGKKAAFNTRMREKELIECEPNTEYYVLKHTFIIRGFNKSKELIENIGVIAAGDSGTSFITGEDTFLLGVSVDKVYDDYDEETDQFMICKNSKADKTWEKGYVDMPSMNYSSEVKGITGDVKLKVQNKNYYDATITEENENGLTYSANKKVLKLNGNITANNKIVFASQNLTKGKYIFHLRLKKGSISSTFKDSILCYLYKSNTWTRLCDAIILNNSNVDNKIIFELSQNYQIQIGMYIRTDDILEDAEIEYEIVRVEDDIDNFIEHEEQNFKVSLGDKILYKGDKIVHKNGKWYFSYIWKKIDDFSKIVSEQTGIQGKRRGWMNLNSNFKLTDSNNNRNGGMCNIAKLAHAGQTYNGDIGFTVGILGNGKRLFLYTEEFSEIVTSQELQQKLTELGVYFVLPIEEAEIELIEDKILINQLDAIMLHLTEYDDVTNFDFDNDVTFEITVEKDRISILENRLNKAEENTTSANMIALEMED